MYSDNDYRYYLEHQLMESDDFLAHYGVKGMKWKNHNYVIDPRLRERMAKGLGGLNRPRINSNPIFQRRNGVSSRLNGARRRAQLGVGRQLMKSKTGRKVLRKAATRDLKNRVNSAKKSFSKAKKASDVAFGKYDDGIVRSRGVGIGGKKRGVAISSAKNRLTGAKSHRIDFYNFEKGTRKGKSLNKSGWGSSWQVGAKAGKPGSGKKLARQAQRKIAKIAIKSKTGRKLLKSAVKNEIKGRAKLKTARGAFKVANSKTGRKVLKKAGQLASSERGRKMLKGAAKLKVKHDVNKLDRKLHRGVNKTVRKAKRSFNKTSVGKTYNDVRKTTRKLGRQIDRQRKINSAKSKARDAYNKATNSETYRQASSTAKRKARSAYNSAKTGASKAAHKAKTQARSTALKTRDRLEPVARKAKTQARSTALKTRDKAVSAGKSAAKKAKTQARSTALKTRDKVAPVAKKAKTQAKSTALKTRDKAVRAGRSVKRRAKKAYNYSLSRTRRY